MTKKILLTISIICCIQLSDAKNNNSRRAVPNKKQLVIKNKEVAHTQSDNIKNKNLQNIKDMEKKWINLDAKISILNRKRSGIVQDITKKINAFSHTVVQLQNNPGSPEAIAMNRYSKAINNEYKSLARDIKEVEKIDSLIAKYIKAQKDINSKIDIATAKMQNVKYTNLLDQCDSKLVTSNLKYILEKSKNIDELTIKLGYEASAGVLRNIAKGGADHLIYPAEPVYVMMQPEKTLEGSSKLSMVEIQIRAGSLVTSPCTATVVFADKFKNNGNVMVLGTPKMVISIYSLGEIFCKLGDVVQYGDVIGKAPVSTSPYSQLYIITNKKVAFINR